MPISPKERMAALRAARQDKNECVWCGKPTIGFVKCEACRLKDRKEKLTKGVDRYRDSRGGVRAHKCSICGVPGHTRRTCIARQKLFPQ